jgi:HAD superfamily hydrolase (TIGR01549 family)
MPQPAPKISAILFDLGSTLIYFDASWPQALERASGALVQRLLDSGLPLDGPAFLADFRAAMQAYYVERETEFIEYTTQYVLGRLLASQGYPGLPPETLRTALDAMYAVTQAHWQTEADCHPTLETLRRQGYRLGLISNAGDDKDVQILIDKAGVRGYFEVILTSAAQGIRKPNPRIFQAALERLGLPPQQAVMVGDTLGADILGAHNAGLYSIWITRRADTPANRAHAQTIRPHAAIASLAELPALLARLPG